MMKYYSLSLPNFCFTPSIHFLFHFTLFFFNFNYLSHSHSNIYFKHSMRHLVRTKSLNLASHTFLVRHYNYCELSFVLYKAKGLRNPVRIKLLCFMSFMTSFLETSMLYHRLHQCMPNLWLEFYRHMLACPTKESGSQRHFDSSNAHNHLNVFTPFQSYIKNLDI